MLEILQTQIKAAIIFVCICWYSTLSLVSVSHSRNPFGIEHLCFLDQFYLYTVASVFFASFHRSGWSKGYHRAIAMEQLQGIPFKSCSRTFHRYQCPFPSIRTRRLAGSLSSLDPFNFYWMNYSLSSIIISSFSYMHLNPQLLSLIRLFHIRIVFYWTFHGHHPLLCALISPYPSRSSIGLRQVRIDHHSKWLTVS